VGAVVATVGASAPEAGGFWPSHRCPFPDVAERPDLAAKRRQRTKCRPKRPFRGCCVGTCRRQPGRRRNGERKQHKRAVTAHRSPFRRDRPARRRYAWRQEHATATENRPNPTTDGDETTEESEEPEVCLLSSPKSAATIVAVAPSAWTFRPTLDHAASPAFCNSLFLSACCAPESPAAVDAAFYRHE
jgi:hypothetical protein